MTELNMDLSHPPVPSDQWARHSPSWSQPYTTSPGVVTYPGVLTRPGYTTRPGTPMAAIIPVSAVSMTKPEPTAQTDGQKALGFISNKLMVGAIAMGLLMGVSALLALTNGVDKKGHDAAADVVAPTQATQPTQPTQVEQPKPVVPAVQVPAAQTARAKTTIDVPVSTLVAVVDGTKEKPATKSKPTKSRPVIRDHRPTPPRTKANGSDADVASSRALLAQANEESTLR